VVLADALDRATAAVRQNSRKIQGLSGARLRYAQDHGHSVVGWKEVDGHWKPRYKRVASADHIKCNRGVDIESAQTNEIMY